MNIEQSIEWNLIQHVEHTMTAYKDIAPITSQHATQAQASAFVEQYPPVPETPEPQFTQQNVRDCMRMLFWGVKVPPNRVPQNKQQWNVRSYRGIARKTGLSFDQVRRLETELDGIMMEMAKEKPFETDPKPEPENETIVELKEPEKP